jgi:hypothetical protein
MSFPHQQSDSRRAAFRAFSSRRTLLSIVLLLVAWSPLRAWDKIDLEQMPSASDFPLWDAVILKDQAEMEIRPDGQALFTQHRIMKIFSDPDKRFSHQELPFNSSIQIVSIKARTIHPDGQEFTLDPAEIKEKSLISESVLYSDVKAKDFYLPRVTANCVVEYEYQLRLKTLLYWADWFFESDLPCLYSAYTLALPRGFDFRMKVLNCHLEPQIDFRSGKQVFLWERFDNSAITKEVFMPPAADSVCRLAFSPLDFDFDGRTYPCRTWNDVAAWYRQISQSSTEPSPKTAELALGLTSGLDLSRPKIEAVFDYVQEHVRYVSVAIGIGAYQPHLPAEILEYGYGDCKDMTSLIISLLQAVRVEAYPALLSTRGHRSLLTNIPNAKQFDHVVVAVPRNEGYFWLDPACRNCRFGQLPFEDQGASALVVRPGEGELVVIPESAAEENVASTRWEIKLNSDGSAAGRLSLAATGQEELAFRASLTGLKPQRRREALAGYLTSWFINPDLVRSEFDGFDEKDSSISIEADFLSGGYGVVQGEELFLPVNLNTQNYLSIMFPSEQRANPVLFDYRFKNEDQIRIVIPPQFEIERLPGAVRLDEPFGLFESTCSIEQDTIIHNRLFVRRQLLVPAEQYPQLKEFYDRAAQEDDARIILRRKSDQR